jgi:hypothetical protein
LLASKRKQSEDGKEDEEEEEEGRTIANNDYDDWVTNLIPSVSCFAEEEVIPTLVSMNLNKCTFVTGTVSNFQVAPLQMLMCSPIHGVAHRLPESIQDIVNVKFLGRNTPLTYTNYHNYHPLTLTANLYSKLASGELWRFWSAYVATIILRKVLNQKRAIW